MHRGIDYCTVAPWFKVSCEDRQGGGWGQDQEEDQVVARYLDLTFMVTKVIQSHMKCGTYMFLIGLKPPH